MEIQLSTFIQHLNIMTGNMKKMKTREISLDQFSQKLSQIQIAANITVRLKRKLKKK